MFKLRALSAALVLVALTAYSTEVGAQLPPEAPKNAGWILTPSIGVGGAWDDNVLMLNPGDNPPSDYATPVNPSVSLDYRGRRSWFSGGYTGSFLSYRTLGQLNSMEQHARGMFRHRANSRLTLFAEEIFMQAPTTDALHVSGVPFFRVGSQTNAAGGGVEAALTRYTTLRGVYTLRQVAFDQEDVALEGGYAHEASLALSRMLSPRFTIGGQYELRRNVLSDGLDRFDIHTPALTVQYDVTRTTRLSGLFGISHLGTGLHHQAQTGPTVRAGLMSRAEFATFSASYQRSFIPAFGFGGTFQNEEWQAAVHVPFARNRAYVEGNFSWSDNDALEIGQPSLQSRWLSSTLGYRATRWLSLEGFYAGAQQDAQRAGGKIDRNQVGFRIVATKPVKLD